MGARLPFVHLRARSAYSLLEGAIRIPQLAELCRARKMPALALTDRNNLFGAMEFSETLAAAGVQPIIGCTLSVALAERALGEIARRPDGALALLVQNETGWRNLMRLSTMAHLDVDAADPPHLPLETIEAHAEGLICLTGGPEGPVNRLIVDGRLDDAAALVRRLAAAFPGRLYIELQRHGMPEEAQAEPFLVNEAYALDLPLVAASDVFFSDPSMHEAHDVLLAISEGGYVASEDRRRVTRDHDFKSGREMEDRFADLPEAVENTARIARRCAFRPLSRAPILPRYASEGRTEAEELAEQARAGLEARLEKTPLAAEREDYFKRLEYELGVIEKTGFPGYFLIVADFIQWAKAQGVPVGPGRGSGAGSVVAWALTITDLDPIRYGLLFERFLNPERVTLPDFDIDFCQERRDEVISYVQSKYGHDRVAHIITFGTLQARAVIRDVGRVMQMPLGQVDRLAKLIPFNPASPVSLADAIDGESRLQAARDEDPDVARLLSIALRLEGLYRNASTHAAGVVIGDRPLVELSPLYRDPRSDIPATQFNMKWVEKAGLVKFDFLGLKTLTVIARALDYLAEQGRAVDLDTLPSDDAATYEMLSTGASIGVFQLESTGMRDTLRKLKPDSIEDIIALISLYRPGPMKNIDTYVARKFEREETDYLHPELAPVLEETYGVIIYQEQVMQIAQILSGYSLGEADILRRAMGKKIKAEMDAQKERFVSGAVERGVAAAKADYIFELVAEFAGYGFNKSHAAAYGLIAWRTAWLKANHRVEFMAALMSLDRHNTDKLAQFFQETRRLGVRVRPPDVNESFADFAVKDGEILYALGAIRNVGAAAMEHVAEVRAQGGRFRDLYDFAERVDPRQVNKRAFENLARAGAFDSLEPSRARALASAETLLALAVATHQDRTSAQESLFGEEMATAVRPPLPTVEEWDPAARLDEELAAIGFYLSGHPLDDVTESLRRRDVVFAAEAREAAAEGRTGLKMAGVVRRRQEKVSSKSGRRFAFVSLSDPTGEYEVLAPPEVLLRARDLLTPGAAVSARVRLEQRDGDLSYFAEEFQPLDRQLNSGATALAVYLRSEAALEGLKARLTVLAERGGESEIRFVLPLDEAREAEFLIPGRYPADSAARGALKSVPGVELVREL